MKPNFDDPRLTAYALGELEDSDAKEIETLLAESPEARTWVEEVKQTATQLQTKLAVESCPSLTEEQADSIEASLRRDRPARESRAPAAGGLRWDWLSGLMPRPITVMVLLAAVFILAGMLLPALSKAKSKARSVSLRNYQQEQELIRMASRIAPPTSNPADEFKNESYAPIVDNSFKKVPDHPLSTFSIDVDTASYAIVRRFLNEGQMPPKDDVRIEEMINYFTYDYPQPKGRDPFSVNIEVAGCPWNTEHRLVRVGLKGREIAQDKRPPSNLIFLIDVSGSMQPANKLPLLKESLKLLTRQLTENDQVAIVVYAGAAGEVLSLTRGTEKARILRALDKLEAGGSTHGSQGIQLAYSVATENFIQGGVNRVVLCTDGDFNVGITNPNDLMRLIQDKAKGGVFLSVLGFGMGNYKDSTTEMLADKGNGNYAYIDTLEEGRKVLVEQMSGTLVTIAKDVKIQVEFNPARASAYRLVGYENRLLRKEDFNNDQKDAGDIGAGHTVTALYEVVPVGKSASAPGVDPLRYQQTARPIAEDASEELLTLKLRYKEPDGDESKLLTVPVTDRGTSYARASQDFKFASSVAAFGMVLRESRYKGTATLESVQELAEEGLGTDRGGYRAEFVTLVEKAKRLSGPQRSTEFNRR